MATLKRCPTSRPARWAAIASIASGALVLAGWQFDVLALRSPLPRSTPMNPATAVCFILGGVALWLRLRPGLAANLAGRICAAALAAVGLLKLVGMLGIVGLLPDAVLYRDLLAVGLPQPNRMAPTTAVNFVLIGLALLLLDAGRGRSRRLTDQFVLWSGASTLVVLLGYFGSVGALTRIGAFIPMALNTAATFLILCVGVLAARPDSGIFRLVTAQTLGGMLARRLLPAAFVIPLVLGWLRLKGERYGLVGLEDGAALVTLGSIVLLVALIWITSERFDRLDEERARGEESRRLLASIVESSDDAIIGNRLDGTILSWNSGAERLYGYAAGEAIGKPISILLPPGCTNELDRIIEPIRQGEHVVRTETVRIRKDGSPVSVALSVSPVYDASGAIVATSMIAVDITERVRSGQEVFALNEHLREHTRRLEQANQELEAFSYSVSHDLRAPLRHVSGFADLLTQRAGATLDEDARRYLKTIRDAAGTMGQLIDDLLVFSRMGHAELRQAVVDLDVLVREVRPTLEPDAGSRDVEWVVAPLPSVRADPAMLRLVLVNLLSNALKYTRPRERARIEIGATEEGGEVVLFVRDNGVGFDMKYAHRLFGVFQRLHSSDEFEGTGIGLANVRRIVQRHGGRTWAEAKSGEGATFYLSLPQGGEVLKEAA